MDVEEKNLNDFDFDKKMQELLNSEYGYLNKEFVAFMNAISTTTLFIAAHTIYENELIKLESMFNALKKLVRKKEKLKKEGKNYKKVEKELNKKNEEFKKYFISIYEKIRKKYGTFATNLFFIGFILYLLGLVKTK